ncbi:galanin receptor 2b-like [Montipora capricornis]|uniref:galanin receptor 2b-like n=1 Tax=Montipora capricornis TaxID=246305 RepID=UPI0035F1F8D6
MGTIEGITLPVVIFGSCFYSIVYVLSIAGNCFVLSLCYRRRASSLKLFIANLAVADLVFALLSILDAISFFYSSWVGGEVSCKLQGYLIEVCYTTTIITLAVISHERIKAVRDPFNARLIALRCASKKVVILWVISLVANAPLLYAYGIVTDKIRDKTVCSNKPFGDLARQIYYGIHSICFFIIPLIYMLYAQSSIFRVLRSNVHVREFLSQNSFTTSSTCRHRKVAKILTVITLVFVICWSPFVICRTLWYFHVCGEWHIRRSSQLLILLNTALDPILYGMYGENFSLKQSIRRCVKCFSFQKQSSRVGIINATRIPEKKANRGENDRWRIAIKHL